MTTTSSAATIVVGNPKANSRTLESARVVASAVVDAVGWSDSAPPFEIDLALVANEIFDWQSAAVAAHVEVLRQSRLAVVASPVYKATYTGLLKAFLDRIGHGELHGVVVVPLMVGGAPQHALAVEVYLRPLLAELGAVLPTRGLFLLESELANVPELADRWLTSESHRHRLRRALGDNAAESSTT
jgi:FMN reductase